MEITVTKNKIGVSYKLFHMIVKKEKEKRIKQVLELIKKFEKDFNEHIQEEMKKNILIKIGNKPCYYFSYNNDVYVIADPMRERCSTESCKVEKFAGYKAIDTGIGKELAKFLFVNNRAKNPMIKKVYGKYCVEYLSGKSKAYTDSLVWHNSNYNSNYPYWYYDVNSEEYNYLSHCQTGINLPISYLSGYGYSFELFLEENLMPAFLSDVECKIFGQLVKMYRDENIYFYNGNVSLDQLEIALEKGIYTSLGDINLEKNNLEKFILNSVVEMTDEEKNFFYDYYLKTDYERANIEPYDEKILFDPNRGHWDLWGENNENQITLKDGIVGRNPLADIEDDGIIGIDFGTKSTIVAYQNGKDMTSLMRIGNGDFKKEIKKEDYENPTVMEFIDIQSFKKSYDEKEGRPETKWSDITVSHQANSQLKDGTDSSFYYSFFYDLKQWCADKTRQTRIKDHKEYEKTLIPFIDLDEDKFNPIEIYAYYLGLFINNMRNGIYLNYVLSFPVTYEKAVRDKIVQSFEKGIKKSLPQEVLDDEESMQKFRIMQGASEPAAYAICALQQYKFEPDEDKPVFYGIFDFGGGTTDFDFGLWRCATDKESRRFDYVIEHFGAGGDMYLGGENLLELLAFNVFKANKDKLIKDNITFYKPAQCDDFAGYELLLSDSQEAKLNTKQLMEKLRGYWQQDEEEVIKEISEGKIKLLLFNNKGETNPGFELIVDKEMLDKVLRDRIEVGVRNFFDAIKLNFSRQDLKQIEEINIFLAGNSSKSHYVKELFDEYIAKNTEEIKKFSDSEKNCFFNIFPPLGCDEADALQKERGFEVDKNDFNRPTGKTGVAYGLIEGRQGSRIKVISEISSEDEIKFKYYLGYNSKKEFKVALDRNEEYGKWVYFIDAYQTDFEIYYTSLPEATTNKLNIKNVNKKMCRIKEENDDDKVGVYIRAVEPTVIEYCVADEEGIKAGQYIEEPIRIEIE